jgi:hypothetical protein
VSGGGAVTAIAAATAWRATRLPWFGHRLVAILTGPDDDAATAAGMLLTRAGDRGIGPVSGAIEAGGTDPRLVTVLQGIGSARARAVLARVAGGAGPLAAPARQALESLDPPRSGGDGSQAGPAGP